MGQRKSHSPGQPTRHPGAVDNYTGWSPGEEGGVQEEEHGGEERRGGELEEEEAGEENLTTSTLTVGN